MKRKIIMITGGQRSGKSRYAEQLAERLSAHPIYMATARIWDAEFAERVRRHQSRRGDHWTTVEEEKWLSSHDVGGRVVLVDCLTLWSTNFFFDGEDGHQVPDVAAILRQLEDEFDRFTAQEATFIFVTNEIGSGGVSENALQRRFTDLQGWFNQYVASKSDEVILMVSGIAVKIKNVDC